MSSRQEASAASAVSKGPSHHDVWRISSLQAARIFRRCETAGRPKDRSTAALGVLSRFWTYTRFVVVFGSDFYPDEAERDASRMSHMNFRLDMT